MSATYKQTILYAEDDQDDLYLVRQAFAMHQAIEVIHAGNGLEAINYLNTLGPEGPFPCLIILDINMPAMDGRQALVSIKKNDRLKEIPVVIFTTSNSQMDKDFATKWGADFMSKPLKYGELARLANEFSQRCTQTLINRA